MRPLAGPSIRSRQVDQQIPLDSTARADFKDDDGLHEVLPDIAYQRQVFVNIVFVGLPNLRRSWVLIDAGLHGSAGAIRTAVNRRFGKDAKPAAIILTH